MQQTYWKFPVLFKPSKELVNVPEWENKAIAYIQQRQQVNSVELSTGINLKLMDTFVILDRLSKARRIEIAPDGKHWQLTAEERIRLRKRGNQMAEPKDRPPKPPIVSTNKDESETKRTEKKS